MTVMFKRILKSDLFVHLTNNRRLYYKKGNQYYNIEKVKVDGNVKSVLELLRDTHLYVLDNRKYETKNKFKGINKNYIIYWMLNGQKVYYKKENQYIEVSNLSIDGNFRDVIDFINNNEFYIKVQK